MKRASPSCLRKTIILRMRHVAAARKEVGQRTIFNLLGPLSNPANATRQLAGGFRPIWLRPVAKALLALGAERAWVVHGAGGSHESSSTRGNVIGVLENGAVRVVRADTSGAVDDGLQGGDAHSNAHALRALLDGGGRAAYRQAVLVNAAAALTIAGIDNADARAAEALIEPRAAPCKS